MYSVMVINETVVVHRRKPQTWAACRREMTALPFIVHIGAGVISLASGTVGILARKGGRLHRCAGAVFVISMLIMATFAAWLAVAVPAQIVNLFIATLVVYLVATGWLTVHRPEGSTGIAERISVLVSLCLFAPFGVLSFQLATGLTPLFKSAVPFKGPVLMAIYFFTFVLALAAIGDARVVLAGGASGRPRILRHLWRMCVALTLATGSAFTNGFARFLPGPYHVPPVFFFPQFLPLGLMFFWMIRVRFPGCFPEAPPPLRGPAGNNAARFDESVARATIGD